MADREHEAEREMDAIDRANGEGWYGVSDTPADTKPNDTRPVTTATCRDCLKPIEKVGDGPWSHIGWTPRHIARPDEDGIAALAALSNTTTNMPPLKREQVIAACDLYMQADLAMDVHATINAWHARRVKAEHALRRIADMPPEPRPDGTFNYDRAAIIQIARTALGEGL